MKAILALIGLMTSVPALGEQSLLDIARDVRDKSGFEKLVAASFGGGNHYEVKGSPFFVVDLMHTSGIPSTELFVFESIDGQLALRLHVPRRSFVVMKAEAQDGMLINSEKSQRKAEWKVCFHVIPTAAGR